MKNPRIQLQDKVHEHLQKADDALSSAKSISRSADEKRVAVQRAQVHVNIAQMYWEMQR